MLDGKPVKKNNRKFCKISFFTVCKIFKKEFFYFVNTNKSDNRHKLFAFGRCF